MATLPHLIHYLRAAGYHADISYWQLWRRAINGEMADVQFSGKRWCFDPANIDRIAADLGLPHIAEQADAA